MDVQQKNTMSDDDVLTEKDNVLVEECDVLMGSDDVVKGDVVMENRHMKWCDASGNLARNEIRGDAPGNPVMDKLNSNYLSVHAGKTSMTDLTEQEFTMNKAIDVSKEMHGKMQEIDLKMDEMDEIFGNIELNDTQMNQLEALNDAYRKTDELVDSFVTELDSAERNGVWNMEIVRKVMNLLEEFNMGIMDVKGILRGLKFEQTQHRKEILVGECSVFNDQSNDPIDGYGECPSIGDVKSNGKETYKSGTLVRNICNGRDMDTKPEEEDMSLDVISNPGTQLVNINNKMALTAELTEMAGRKEVDQEDMQGKLGYGDFDMKISKTKSIQYTNQNAIT